MRFGNSQQLTSYGRLNGSTTYATIPAELSLDLTGRTTISGGCWFKFDSNAANFTLVSHMMGIRCPTGSAAIVQLAPLNVNVIRCGIDEGSSTQNFDFTVPELKARAWNHIYSAVDLITGIVRLWLNGILVGQTTGTFAGPIASGAGSLSYLGSNSVGSALWIGFLRDFVVSYAAITDSMVMDLYQKGHVPPESYHWPCDESRGTVLACYRNSERYPIFDATLVGASNLFSLDVPVPPRISDLDTNYVWLDGIADFYLIQDELVNPYLIGKSRLAMSGWGYLDRLGAGTIALFYLPEATSGTAFSLDVTNAGAFRAVARSRDSGFASVLTPSANHWANGFPIRQWFHAAHEADFTAKTHKFWLNGRAVRSDVAVAWEDNTYQCLPAAASHVVFGNGLGLWPGRIGPCRLFSPATPMTNAQAFDLYTKDEVPYNAINLIDFRIPDLVAPVDRSPQAFPVTGSSIAAPYGPKHRMYGGIGR